MILFAAVDVEAAASRCADQSSADGRRAVSRQLGTSIARPYTQPVLLQERFAEDLLGGGPYPCPSKWPGRSRRVRQDRAAPGTAQPRARENEWAVNHNQTTADDVLEHRLR